MAYDFALQKSMQRERLFREKPQAIPVAAAENIAPPPVWRNITVQPGLPPSLLLLKTIAENTWWSWNPEAVALFESIDPAAWTRCAHNPLTLLRQLDLTTIRKLENDAGFLDQLSKAGNLFHRYMSQSPGTGPQIAWFCMEYGILPGLKLYAGGLGILAGDYLKGASDAGTRLVAVGLLFRHGYFRQKISPQKEQQALPEIMTGSLPVIPVTADDGSQRMIELPLPGRTLYAAVWSVPVGRVTLYLLDTDLPANTADDRLITSVLYGGSQDTRLKQQILLGAGGVRMLTSLGIRPDVCHLNEGHAAFAGFERIHQYIHQEHLGFEEALEMVKSTTLFTTHTAEPAAQDVYDEELLRTYFGWLSKHLNISWEQLMALGQAPGTYNTGKFSMLYLAAHIAQEINAVSKKHQEISRKVLLPLWKDFRPTELHINYITNGVHAPTWMAEDWRSAVTGEISDERCWEIHTSLKRRLIRTIHDRLNQQRVIMQENTGKAFHPLQQLNEKSLIIGFSRRFTPYKRAGLLFSNMRRLAAILGNASRPVHIIIAGKAHPDDEAGKALLKLILTSAANSPVIGERVIFLEDYDMSLAASLVQGTDLWLNTPRRGHEASGTSGMKAALNGVLQLSVDDGWWSEAADDKAGWTISTEDGYADDTLQDEIDADLLYRTLENEVMPLYFDRNQAGLPEKWIAMMKHAINCFRPVYGMERVTKGYASIYKQLQERSHQLCADNYQPLRKLVSWKKSLLANWKQIHLMDSGQLGGAHATLQLGETLPVKIRLYMGELPPGDVGVEIVFSERDDNENFVLVHPLSLTGTSGNIAVFEAAVPLPLSGEYTYSFRVFPKHPMLPHRQDFPLLMWV
ncbi:alpha-glucan family phosphorylase [Chitinophaga pollutisoli]|uniref:glycogen phosphorylase n=1 Tax=Chitinophaga pollutisoli TaxID=3133966 RepID=A0ABZ2YMT3_9BACT